MVGKLTRRDVLKTTGAAAGALGSLAEGTAAEESEAGGQESVTLSFWSGLAAESQATREHFRSKLKEFESRKENVNVDLQAISYGDMKEKIISAVEAENPPDLGEPGSAGIQFYLQDKVVDHGSYIEEAEGIPENWTEATVDAAQFQGEWWATGQNRHNVTLLTVRPKFFKQVGVDDPSGLETWTEFRRAVEKIDQEFDAVAYEETGVWNDLESYWGQARTAWTGGSDPWFAGETPWQNPQESLLVGGEDRTDGIIKHTVDMARAYSSSQSAQRTDEEIPPVMLTDRIASMNSGLGTVQRWRAVNEDAEFGWDGDVWMGPHPRLDPNYGNEFGIDELADKEGQHGGHAWALLMQKQIFEQSNDPDLAWDLALYTNTDEGFIIPLVGEVYTAIPSYQPYMQKVLDAYDLEQIHEAQIESMNEYGPQYATTGAVWDLEQTDSIRWDQINETISEAIAGQHSVDDTPGVIRDRVMKTLGG